MLHTLRKPVWCVLSISVLLVISQSAFAQRGGGGMARLFGPLPAVTLAQLDTVQQELKLTDEQKQKVAELNEQLNDERREAFESAAGNFGAMRETIAKLYDEYSQKFNAALEESQQQRAREIYVQVNGPIVLLDDEIAKELNVTAEQKQKLEQAREESRQEAIASFQGFQDLSEEERAAKGRELLEKRDQSLLAVVSDEQKAQLEKMKGQAVNVDLSELPRRGR